MQRSNETRSLDNIRHSLAHLLAASVLKKFPGVKLGIGPTIENGFYYDFLLPRSLTPDDLKELEKEMRRLISERLSFTGKIVTSEEARKLFREQRFKLDLIKELTKAPNKKNLKIYKAGSVFTDLCKGGHVKNTSEINPEAFRLTKIAGAYWRGDEKNPQLQRIYGLAFGTKKELDEHLKMLQEAEKRDHKKLGRELDLFTFSELVGSGLPLFTPKGTIIRNLLDDFLWSLREKRGYQRVDIPHITKKELYEKSGHWDKFGDDLFRITTREGHEFALKPMNCPHHIQIFSRKKWSFRELPQRYASTTKVYRDEQTGELAGLSRVRSITQDDAHVFAGMENIEEELKSIWDIVHEFYGAFKLPLRLRLSLRDPKEPRKYLGDAKLWKEAEDILRKVAKDKGSKYFEGVGEATFYGPKLDFIATDSLGREWQVATIQLDLNMPKRFGLTFTDNKGRQSPVFMIHAAIMGSIERFLSALIEHYAGAFPVWLAPEQIWVLPIGQNHEKYAKEVAEKLKAEGIRAELHVENETVNKRIREGELQKIPYLVVVGDREMKSKTITVRKRGHKNLVESKLEKFVEKIKEEIKNKS